MPWGTKSWTRQGKARDMGGYYLVSFEKKPSKIPSIGTNGCIMRRKLIIENAKADPKNHYPIDVMVDMIMKGYKSIFLKMLFMLIFLEGAGVFTRKMTFGKLSTL